MTTHERPLADVIRDAQEMTERNAPLYEIVRRMNAQREAERAAVKALKEKSEISKSDLMRIFLEERDAIRQELDAAESALEDLSDAARDQLRSKRKIKRDADDLRLNIDPLDMAHFAAKSCKDFSSRVLERLRDVESAIMKL